MAFFRKDGNVGFVSISVAELKALLDEHFPHENRERYLLYPNTLGNLAISSHFVDGPQGPGKYYLGFIDLAKGEVRWANKEGDFPANSFVQDDGEILNGANDDANGPAGDALMKQR
jgi:hypothetical protein